MGKAKRSLVSLEILLELEDSLDGERSLAQNFVSRFIDMWPQRFDHIYAAVTSGNNANALDSTLSLRSSALMVGASQLGTLSNDLIRLLEGCSHSEAIMKMASLKSCGNSTTAQLRTLYLSLD